MTLIRIHREPFLATYDTEWTGKGERRKLGAAAIKALSDLQSLTIMWAISSVILCPAARGRQEARRDTSAHQIPRLCMYSCITADGSVEENRGEPESNG